MTKKAILYLVLAAATLLLLVGCAETASPESRPLRVSVEESPWVVTEDNGIAADPGADVTFHMEAADGFYLTGTDYSGSAKIAQEGNSITLTLENVRYPTRVKLHMASNGFALRYDPNGGDGEAFTVMVEKAPHLRPNTANAQVPFSRANCTLLGWNTAPDGTGISVGLGSRVTVGEAGITLYAQWAAWTDDACFDWQPDEAGAVITGCSYTGQRLVIPGELGGLPVARLAEGAFAGCPAETVVLPQSLLTVDKGCFSQAAVKEVYLFDNIEKIYDASFDASGLQTLHINAVEPPTGSAICKESCYADKLDLLILSQDKNRAVFYGGCSMWYNLDMPTVLTTLGSSYFPVNMGLNGTVNSELQLQIMLPYLHAGDLFFHTPELSSDPQMLRTVSMGNPESRLWAGIEYNYDMLLNADLRSVTGELDSLRRYLSKKEKPTSYGDVFQDSEKHIFCGSYGEIPFLRYASLTNELGDAVSLNPALFTEESTQRLAQWYARLQSRGLRVFVSFACVNMDALPQEERGNIQAVDDAFREAIGTMPGVVLLSELSRFTFRNGHFYDTNYHLLSNMAAVCTTRWMDALKPYL